MFKVGDFYMENRFKIGDRVLVTRDYADSPGFWYKKGEILTVKTSIANRIAFVEYSTGVFVVDERLVKPTDFIKMPNTETAWYLYG